MYLISPKIGTKRQKATTQFLEVCMQWKDGSTNWMNLKDVKDSFKIELDDYAVGNRIPSKTAFEWWVPYILNKQELILSKLKTKYWHQSSKYGI